MCFAQAEQGGIAGSVVDASGASIAKARIAATNQATGAVTRVETTAEGYYKIPYLPAGKYSMTVESAGFATHKVADVPVLVGQIATIDATLKPGSLHDEVTVTANAVADRAGELVAGVRVRCRADSGVAHRPQPLFAAHALARRDRDGQRRDGADRQRRALQHYGHPVRRPGHPQ